MPLRNEIINFVAVDYLSFSTTAKANHMYDTCISQQLETAQYSEFDGLKRERRVDTVDMNFLPTENGLFSF